MKKTFLFAVVLTGLFIACSKDKDNPPAPPPVDPPVDTSGTDNPPPVITATDLFTAHIWNIDTIALDTDRDGIIDTGAPGGFEACDLDNTLLFNTDSTGAFDEGPMKCEDATAQTVPFIWYLTNSDSVVNINGDLPGELHGDVNVLALTDSTLVMSKPIPYSGSTVNLIISLKK